MNLVPANPVERRTADVVQQTAAEVTRLAIRELRQADAVHAVGNQLIEAMIQEQRNHREMTDAWKLLDDALRNLNDAERIMRSRGETNGH